MENLIHFTPKPILKLLLIFLITTISFWAQAQTVTKKEVLKQIAQKENLRYKSNLTNNNAWALKNNLPTRFERNGKVYELRYIDQSGRPRYIKTNNATAAATVSTNKLYPLGGLGLNLTGNGIIVHEWDAGVALLTHQEFVGRITDGDGAAADNHATHVGGTIMAAGVQAQAKGMAYEAHLKTFDWNNDLSEMATEAANGSLISNHSYGTVCGWEDNVWYGDPNISTQEDYSFGFYSYWTAQYDNVAYNAPYYLICKAAGNDRNDSGDGSYPPDGPYDCIEQYAIAKNILTVGAVEDIPAGYTQVSDVVATSFSSWGPADDGRIKPDIVANGAGLYSASKTNNTAYTTMSGTSMATPSVTGSLALLQQHYYNLKGNFMLSSTLKALAIHTADEAGPNPGPDYMFGWGLLNTAKAAQLISTDMGTDVISEHVLSNGASYQRQVVANGTEALKVSIVWLDPPGTAVAASLDPANPMLVNDLDLHLSYQTTNYYPWKLDRLNPSSAATNNTDNNVDNVEVVYIENPVAGGTYTINIDHNGTLTNGSQSFSLIISGIQPTSAPIANFTANTTSASTSDIITFTDLSTNAPATWLWSFSPSTYTFENGTNANSQNPQVNFYTEGQYTATLVATNTAGSDTETKTNYVTISGCIGFPLPYSEGFESGQFPPSCWTVLDADGDSYNWQQGISGEQSIRTGQHVAFSESFINDIGALTPDNWLITPGFSCTTDSVVLKFWASAQDNSWLNEHFSILISTNGNSIGEFTEIFSHTINAEGYQQFIAPITNIKNENLHIAFRHWNTTDMFQLLIDDVSIEEFIKYNDTVSNQTISDGTSECFNATNQLTVAGDAYTVIVEDGASANFIAGQSIRILPGFHAQSGSMVNAYITTNDTYCFNIVQAAASASELIAHNTDLKSASTNKSTTKETIGKHENIIIYPNPNNGKFTIDLHELNGLVNVNIYNTIGSKISNLSTIAPNVIDLELQSAPKGLYYVLINNSGKTYSKKVVISNY